MAHLTDKDNLSAHWFVGQGNQVAPVGSQLLAYYEEAPIHVQNIAIVYDRVISSRMTNQLLAGVNYFNQVFNDYETPAKSRASASSPAPPFPMPRTSPSKLRSRRPDTSRGT